MVNKRTLEDLQVQGKRVLVRCDFNVPMDETGNITDDRRIISSLPTIKYLIDNNAKVIIMSHLGRPKGVANPKFTLETVAHRLSKLLNREVIFAKDNRVISQDVKKLLSNMEPKSVVLLENTRFRKGEEENNGDFARELASLGEVYINDAFGTSHRAHASNVGVASHLPSAVGYLIERELSVMGKALSNPQAPFTAILGGAKVSDKIGVIDNLLNKVDSILIGGGMAYTFLKSKGYEIGKSILEEDKVELAGDLIKKAKTKGVELLLPTDVTVAGEFKNDTDFKTVDINSIPKDMMGMDIGRETIELFMNRINEAKTIVWNGPMGVFEMDNFKVGTEMIARAMAESKAITIIGGGDSASAVEKAGYSKKMTHISTGGGASLEFLEGKSLPGIDCIDDR